MRYLLGFVGVLALVAGGIYLYRRTRTPSTTPLGPGARLTSPTTTKVSDAELRGLEASALDAAFSGGA
jgi:hypothetical protein